MDANELLDLFGGSHENVCYFLGLRDAQGSDTMTFDHRDGKMRDRLQELQWKPKLVLKPFHEIEYSDSNKPGCGPGRKQMALEGEGLKEGADDEEEEEQEKENEDIDSSISEDVDSRTKDMLCGVQGCSLTFTSLASYESHYHTCHNYSCSHCKRSFVSDFLLDLHLQENHDSYFEVLSARIDMYRCLVEECQSKFRTAELRKDHLVTQHKFPASFAFHQPIKTRLKNGKESTSSRKGKKGKPSSAKAPSQPNGSGTTDGNEMEAQSQTGEETSAPIAAMETSGQSKRSKRRKAKQERMECIDGKEESCPDNNVDMDSQHQSSRGRGGRGRGGNKAPTTICFGRGSQRAFKVRGRGGHWHQWGRGDGNTKTDIEQMDFKDISDALED